MSRAQRRDTARVNSVVQIGRTRLIIGIALAIVFGYIIGTNSGLIRDKLGSLVGIPSYSGTLDLSSVQETYQRLKANFVDDIDDADLIEGVNRGLVEASGDPHTIFMTSEEAAQFDKDLSGSIGGGIGVEVGIRNDQPTAIRILEDTPAAEAKLQAGDVFKKVNDSDVVGASVEDVVGKIRGDIGTSVKITVDRSGQERTFSITRADIVAPSVDTSIKNDVGIMRISRFDNNTASQARAAAQEFVQKKVSSVIVDVRDNGGGYVNAAQSVAGLWLDDKVIVRERKKDGIFKELKTGRNPLLGGKPTIVLINGGSASASEILAGALNEHGAARLVGEKTFGKGTVQQIFRLSSGARVKITVARWYTPNDKDISDGGIAPDFEVKLTRDNINADRDPQLEKALQQLK